VREGFRTTLSELRLQKESSSSRKRWLSVCGQPSLFIVGRERAKLGYFWRHAYRVPRSGPYLGCAVNSDTGKPVMVNDSRVMVAEFEKVKIAETIETREGKSCRSVHSPLGKRIPTGSAAWPRLNSSDATCRDGSITRFATRFTN
jgi:hypothetical protein